MRHVWPVHSGGKDQLLPVSRSTQRSGASVGASEAGVTPGDGGGGGSAPAAYALPAGAGLGGRALERTGFLFSLETPKAVHRF